MRVESRREARDSSRSRLRWDSPTACTAKSATGRTGTLTLGLAPAQPDPTVVPLGKGTRRARRPRRFVKHGGAAQPPEEATKASEKAKREQERVARRYRGEGE